MKPDLTCVLPGRAEPASKIDYGFANRDLIVKAAWLLGSLAGR
jgi:hypothetical protein